MMSHRWALFLLGWAFIQGVISLNPIPEDTEEWEEYFRQLRDPLYRLPTTTRPHHYEVTLTPYFDVVPFPNVEPFTFDGDVVIYLRPTIEDVSQIVMHCNDLTIFNVTVEYVENNVTNVITSPSGVYECDPTYSFVRINTTENLQLNQEYAVKISFKGNLQTNMRGFYRSWYYDSTGKRWMGTTQFQPGHARQAFPCYDEPGFKATFDITINRQASFSPSISNMPIRTNSTLSNGFISETFHTTPVTSTYLLAFIVSHYRMIATNNDVQRPFDIYARDNAGTTGDWSLQIGELLLDEMEKYTDIPYYNVTDHMNMKQAAIPDFSAGAMENWGLLTYREALILYDPQNSNHFYKQRVANIVSHEITHMWFGNLVTCAWWDNLWLNEGFARFYQYYLTGVVAEDLGFETRFIVEQLQSAMFSDSIDTAHPLTDPSVNSPTTVSNHFSVITYARGAAILRMTQHLLGEETFKKGIRIYLKERQFDVAEPHHLFTALDQAAAEDNALAAYGGITINEYFRTWSEKAGHPLLSVAINQRTGQMTVTQERWERNTGVSQFPSTWHVPITWTRGGDPDFQNLKPSQFITAQSSVIARGTIGLEWVIFNKQESGFYRVNYDETNWALLTRALRSNEREVIHELNRAQIVDDIFALARASVMPYRRAFNILSFLQFDDAYAPWIAAINGYAFVLRRLAHQPENLQKLQSEINNLSTAVVNRLGYRDIENEPYMDGLLRLYVMQFLCNIGHEQCVSEATTNFRNWRNGTFVPANMRPWVYCVGLREGTADDFDYFWNRYLADDLSSEKIVMIQAAGCTSDQASLNKFLDVIASGSDDIRPQDYNTAINSALTGNENNTMRVFQWLRNNLSQISQTAGISNIVSGIGTRLLNEADMAEFSSWLGNNTDTLGSVYNTGINSIETARNFLAWTDRRVGEMETYFDTGYEEDLIEDITDGGDPEPEPEGPSEDGDGAASIAASIITLFVAVMINLVI